MLDVKLVRTATDSVAAQLKKRGFSFDKDRFVKLESERKQLQVNLQELQNERNVRSRAVGLAKAAGESTEEPLTKLKEISEAIKLLDAKFVQIQNELDDFLYTLPNILHDSVPEGYSEEDNQVMRTWGEPTVFSFTPKDHVDLGINLGVRAGFMDFEAAAKISGARFVVLRGPLARLQRALIQFMLDLHTEEHGYQEISVPYLVLVDTLYGTGQLPKFKEDLFALKGETDRYLISTSEIPVTNTIRDEIIDVARLPMKYVCYSTCFRSEAGSYGKDMRGMLRQHQFEKVELVQIVKPELSYQALESLTQHAEVVLQKLALPYRVVALSAGDVGFSAAKTYDLEVWLPGQSRYREISSCSNTEAFQARRMKARFRNESGDIEWVHTLNGSGLAVGRTLIAILENYQDELGRIRVPTVLQSYMGGMQIIE